MAGKNAFEQAQQLAQQGRLAEARAVLERSADGGDAQSAGVLANLMLTGRPFGRDLGASRRWFARAAELGDVESRDSWIAFLANGTGGERDWNAALVELRRRPDDADYARQLRLLDAMALTADGDPAAEVRGESLSELVGAVQFAQFLTQDECDYLIALSQPAFKPSMVIDPVTGQFISDPIRRSDLAAFPLAAERPAVHAINRRIARATGTQVSQGEPLQILRYTVGQEYRQHHDAIPNTDNQRAWTFLIYLNAEYEGGETVFPKVDLRFRGAPGDALFFRNSIAGQPDPNAVHIGMPVTKGVKFLASRWIRERPLDLRLKP